MSERITDQSKLDLSQLHLDVVFGRASGKIIWQPRIGCWLVDKEFAGQPLPEPYTGMTKAEIYRCLGCSSRIYEFNQCFKSQEDPAVQKIRRELNETDYEIQIETPVGIQQEVFRRTANSPRPIRLKWGISDEKEMKVAIWREHRRSWSFDRDKYDELCHEWAGLGAPTMFMPRPTIQDLYINTMGVEAGVFALMDYPSTCEAYFEALNENHQQLIGVINSSPIQIVNFGDNIHSGTLSPAFFEKYVLPVYHRRCELLHKAGKFVHAHWDGDCKPLLPYAKDTCLDGIEAITPKPQGDVTLEEVKQALGDMFLIDGIPAVYFDETFSEQVLIDCVRKCIDLFAPNLILGISDEISSTGNIERIRLVGKIVDEYNASL